MNRLSNKKGFTLIELIVVIAILGIIATIAVPRTVGIVEHAKLSADRVTVKTLNKVTPIFRILNSSDNSFTDGTDDTALIGVLVDNRYLNSVVEPQSEDATFTWKIEDEQWYLNFSDSNYSVTLADGLTIASTGWWESFLKGTYDGDSKDIVIPIKVDGIVVEQIYQDVFNFAKTGIKLVSVAFDSNSEITHIHARAFLNNNLASVIIPDTVKYIDLQSFKDNDLTEIKLSASLETIQQKAFKGNDLTEIELPGGLETIGIEAFDDNDDLNKITIGSNVTTIGDNAFGNDNKFRDAYQKADETGGAGTYLRSADGTWTKQ